MLTGTLATLTDTHWFNTEGEHRLDQLITAFFRRSNTAILIEGPDRTQRLREFLYAYLKLSHQIIEMINDKSLHHPGSKVVFKLKQALQDCYSWNMKCDQLSALSMAYVQLRIIEELSPYLNWLSEYDITLSNALVHTLLEPTGVHQLDKKAHVHVNNIRMNLKSHPLKCTESVNHDNRYQSKQTSVQIEVDAPHLEALPCFSHQWGIHWCVAIGV